jgi:AcrR family transcriptional regulator
MKPQKPQSLPSLRERKKAKTKALIQVQALRLFTEQGYDGTSVEQIAEAAEVSPSTFFRYFPTKEAVVLHDILDPLIIENFRSQPPELNSVQAIRRALKKVYSDLPEDQLQREMKRSELMHVVPELQSAMLGEYAKNIGLISNLIAQRTGRSADDISVRVLAGAIIGVIMSALLQAYEDPKADYLRYYDEALGQLEKGFPL